MTARTHDLFRAEAPRIARVALPVPVDSLFDYALPEEFSRDARVGCRVRVLVRRRRETGVIVALANEPERAGLVLRPIEALLDVEPALPAALLAAITEEARATLCPLGIALAAALPPGSAPRTLRALALTPRGREALRSAAARGGVAEHAWLARHGVSAAQLTALERDGLVEPALRIGNSRPLFGADNGRSGQCARCAESWTACGARAAIADVDTFFQVEMKALEQWRFTSEDAQRIRQPLVSVVGEESPPAFWENHALIRQWMPQAEELTIPRANHGFPHRNPSALAGGLARFLRGRRP